MNPFTKFWFWLLLLAIIGLILTFIFIEVQSSTSSGQWIVPTWIWVVFGLAIFFALLSFILFCFDMAAYYRRLEIAIACGELPPPTPKKKIDCPRKKCLQVVEYVPQCYEVVRPPCEEKKQCIERKPCEEKKQCKERNPCEEKKQCIERKSCIKQNPCKMVKFDETIVSNQNTPPNIEVVQQEAFAAANIKSPEIVVTESSVMPSRMQPLSVLSPME